MSGSTRICIESIEDVCKTYGFDHTKEGSSHFATVDGKKIEVVFQETGGLPRGPHAFMSAARAANEQFAADYPSRKAAKKRAAGKKKKGKKPSLPVLDERFFLSYSYEKLRNANGILTVAMERRKVQEEMRDELATVVGKIADMEAMFLSIAHQGYEPTDEMAEDAKKLSERKTDIEVALDS